MQKNSSSDHPSKNRITSISKRSTNITKTTSHLIHSEQPIGNTSPQTTVVVVESDCNSKRPVKIEEHIYIQHNSNSKPVAITHESRDRKTTQAHLKRINQTHQSFHSKSNLNETNVKSGLNRSIKVHFDDSIEAHCELAASSSNQSSSAHVTENRDKNV